MLHNAWQDLSGHYSRHTFWIKKEIFLTKNTDCVINFMKSSKKLPFTHFLSQTPILNTYVILYIIETIKHFIFHLILFPHLSFTESSSPAEQAMWSSFNPSFEVASQWVHALCNNSSSPFPFIYWNFPLLILSCFLLLYINLFAQLLCFFGFLQHLSKPTFSSSATVHLTSPPPPTPHPLISH